MQITVVVYPPTLSGIYILLMVLIWSSIQEIARLTVHPCILLLSLATTCTII